MKGAMQDVLNWLAKDQVTKKHECVASPNMECDKLEDGDCARIEKPVPDTHHRLVNQSAEKNELKDEQNEKFSRKADGTVNPIMMKGCQFVDGGYEVNEKDVQGVHDWLVNLTAEENELES
eukprot:42082-Alexandrium_andersonii.AAC.1